jgi:hypothetical protein
MKKYIAALLAIFGIAAFLQIYGMEEPVNMKKSREEIEIMKGILETTLSYAAQNLSQQAKPAASTKAITVFGTRTIHSPMIHAFRLKGQGVVFTIPITSMPISDSSVFAGNVGNELSRQIESAIRSGELLNQLWLTKDLQTIPQSPTGQDPSAQKREELLKKKAEELQAKMQKRREEDQAKKEKMLRDMAEIKSRIIESLANYGDSFTTIKPDEYINFVLTPGSGFSIEIEPSSYSAISIKRSWIADYKAGKLTLDSFKQKALNYSE